MRTGLVDAPKTPAPTGVTAYLAIQAAVEQSPGLIHGRLDQGCDHCAIGWYFAVDSKRALGTAIIDEVAIVNDSVPTYDATARRAFVLRWLKWKLQELGWVSRGRKIAREPQP